MPRTHKKLQRLYVSDALAPGVLVSLEKGQANYLANVLRRKPGDEVILFNGRDGAWLAGIVSLSRKSISLECSEQIAPQLVPGDLWFGFAPLKSARLDYMAQKATEMGVSALQPVITRFTQGKRFKPERLRANIVEAAEQCEVLAVPTLLPQTSLQTLLENWQPERALIFADEAMPAASPLDQIAGLAGRPLGLLVGPEGGFSSEERDLLRAQNFVTPISLGPRILRADTAAVAALALIQSKIGDWRDHR